MFESLWGSLLSIGQLCDLGLTAIFDKTAVYIVNTTDKEVILTGKRDPQTKLWMIAIDPITPQQEQQAVLQAIQYETQLHQANALSHQKFDNAGDRVEFFSRIFCSATESTLINAVKKGWIKYPGITVRTLQRHKHRLRTPTSAAGHLDQTQQNRRPRQYGTPIDPNAQQQVITTIATGYNHMDATGRLPTVSHRGHQYLLIMYCEDSNYIKAIPMKSRHKQSYLEAHQEGLAFFTDHGYRPRFQRLDNETSRDFLTYLQENNIAVDLAPPHQHRRNKAERAIRTFKNHFIATLAGLHASFPLYAWNELLPHIEITLNLLRPSPEQRQAAWSHLHGEYDFNAHPLAPPGTAVTIHEKPQQRGTWSNHGVKGFYVGPALQHYRCYNTWVNATHATRVTDTLAWHPHDFNWPTYSPLELVIEATDQLNAAIHHLTNSNPHTANQPQPLTEAAAQLLTAIHQLRTIIPEPPQLPSPPDQTSNDTVAPPRCRTPPSTPPRQQRVHAPTLSPKNTPKQCPG